MERVGRVGISDTTVWRHHKEVASKVETEVEREEQEVPISALWQVLAATLFDQPLAE